MSFREVLDERSTVAALVTCPLDPNYWHDYLVKRLSRVGYNVLRDIVEARLEYEVASRAGEGGFCDFLEPSGRPIKPSFIPASSYEIGRLTDPSPKTAVSPKEESEVGRLFFVPHVGGTAPERYRLFETTNIKLPESEADLFKLDAVHHTLFPLYHHGYRELCDVNGIEPADIREVKADDFYRKFVQWAFELDSNKSFLDQVRAKVKACGESEERRIRAVIDVCTPTINSYSLWPPEWVESEESVRRPIVSKFSEWFLREFDRCSMTLFRKSGNPHYTNEANKSDGELKLQLLKEDQTYRRDAQIFSKMHLEKANEDFERSREEILEALQKSFSFSWANSPEANFDAERVLESMTELIQYYANEMCV